MKIVYIVSITAFVFFYTASTTTGVAAGCSVAAGDEYAARGRLEQAIRAYNSCPRSNVLATFKRARTYLARKEYGRAAEDFAAVVRLRPTWSKAQGGLAWSLYKQQEQAQNRGGERLQQALAAAKAAVMLSPGDYYAWHTLGVIQEALGKPLYQFARSYRVAWKQDPEHKKGWADLVRLNAIFDWSNIA
jgi:tetratricopeptide (TPR) repeat protein